MNITKTAFLICASLSSLISADAYNNSIELRNDSSGSQYFSFRYRESYEKNPVAYYLQSRDPDTWVVKTSGAYTTGGSCNAVIWGIKAEYDAVDGMVEGTDYSFFRDRNISSRIELRSDLYSIVTRDMDGFPADYNVSRTFGNHQQDWDFLVAKKNEILDSAGLTDSSSDWDKAYAMALHCYNFRQNSPIPPEGLSYWLHPVDFLVHSAYCVGISNGFAGLCAVMGIPTRLLRSPNHQWAEALIDGKWRYCENSSNVLVMGEETNILSGTEQGPLFTCSFADILVNPVIPYYVEAGSNFSQSVISDAFMRYDLDFTSQWRFYCAGGGGIRAQHSNEKPQMGSSLASAQEVSLLYSGTVTTVRVAPGETGMWLNAPLHGAGFFKGWKSGRVDQANGIRQRFYLSDTTGLTEIKSYLIIDSASAYDMPADGGDWYYSVNGHRHYLRDHGGWHLDPHPFNDLDTVRVRGARSLVFSIPLEHLKLEMNTTSVSHRDISPAANRRISMHSSASAVTFVFPFERVYRAALLSTNGRVLKRTDIENNRITIPRSTLPSGMYILSVDGEKGMHTFRFAIP